MREGVLHHGAVLSISPVVPNGGASCDIGHRMEPCLYPTYEADSSYTREELDRAPISTHQPANKIDI